MAAECHNCSFKEQWCTFNKPIKIPKDWLFQPPSGPWYNYSSGGFVSRCCCFLWCCTQACYCFSPNVILCGWLGFKHQLTNWLLLLSHQIQASGQRKSLQALHFEGWGCCCLCLWHKPSELAHSLSFWSCVCFCLYGPFNCISLHKFSWQLFAFSLCSSRLIFAFLVLSTLYLFTKVSLSPDMILCGWLGLKYQITKLSTKHVLKSASGQQGPHVSAAVSGHVHTAHGQSTSVLQAVKFYQK